MKVKDEVLKTLELTRGVFFSGEELAERLAVSRNAVWKAIKTLQQEGYEINATPNKGYCLAESSDKLSSQGVEKYLINSAKTANLAVYKCVSSTNTVAKELAATGASEGAVVVSESQTDGRGRKSRSFFSPEGTGIYLSILLRPDTSLDKLMSLTTMAAVAVSEAIEKLSGKQAKIKWVNDVFVDGKKVCGILTEAATDVEGGGLEYAVVGIGVNITSPSGGFPKEIRDVAGAVFGTEQAGDMRNRFVAEILNSYFDYYFNFDKKLITKKYIERDTLAGREVKVIKGENQLLAKALGIDEDCHLIVEYPDKTKETLYYGEISVKL